MAHKLFIFVPAFGQIISATTFLTTHALQQHLASKSIQGGISTLSFPDIAELRSMAMTIWYDTMKDSSHMLFIDADMGFQPDMVTDMMMFDEPLVGAIYAQRKLPLAWAGSGTGDTVTERRGNFMKVEGVGMGCTLIRRDVVTKMIEKFPELIDTRLTLHPAGDTIKAAGTNRLLRFWEKLDIADRGLVSEDLSFCIRWRECGGDVWAAIGYRISHVGPFDFAGRYLDIVETQQAQASYALEQPLPPLEPSAGGSTVTEPFVVTEVTGPAEPVDVAAERPEPVKPLPVSAVATALWENMAPDARAAAAVMVQSERLIAAE